jgi:SAM-dependent methyltransferase
MRNQTIETSIHDRPIDFGKTAADYARHRQGFPPRFYDLLEARGVRGRVVDLGTGTGTVARALAARGARVTGVDVSAPLLAAAAQLPAGTDVTWHHAPAEATGLAPHAYDAITAGQCWHWFDRARATREVARLLAPGGVLAIAHLDWIDEPGVVGDSMRLLEQHRGAPMPTSIGGTDGVYLAWPRELRALGVTDLAYEGFDCDLVYTHEGWRGRIRASAFVGAVMPPDQAARFDAALAELLAARYEDPVAVPHRVFAVFATF